MTEPLDPNKIAYQVDEAAKAVGLSRRRIYELIKSGTLPSSKKLGRRLIRRADLEALIEGAFTQTAA